MNDESMVGFEPAPSEAKTHEPVNNLELIPTTETQRGMTNQRYRDYLVDEDSSLFDDLSSNLSTPIVDTPSCMTTATLNVICTNKPIIIDQEQHQQQLVRDLTAKFLRLEFGLPTSMETSTLNAPPPNNKGSSINNNRPASSTPSLKTGNKSNNHLGIKKTNQRTTLKENNQTIVSDRTNNTSKRSGSAHQFRSTTTTKEYNNVKKLEKAMDTLYLNRNIENHQMNLFNDSMYPIIRTEHVLGRQISKKTLKILVDNPNNVELVSDRMKVRYEGTKKYTLNNKQTPEPGQSDNPKSECELQQFSHDNGLTVWEKLKTGTANLKKRIELMKSSLQRSGSQLRVESILMGGVSSANLLMLGASSSKLPTFKRSATRRELTKAKAIPSDLFNENSILCKIYNLLSNLNNKDKVKIRWHLKKKFKLLIAQEKARKKEANLKGIYENRNRLSKFQLQAVLNTVQAERIAPEMEVQTGTNSKKNSSTPTTTTSTKTSSVKSCSPNNMDNVSRISTPSLDYHDRNREDILKQLHIIEDLNSAFFSNHDISRKVKFGDPKKRDSKSPLPVPMTERSQLSAPSSSVDTIDTKDTMMKLNTTRPQTAGSLVSEPVIVGKKWNMQDVMIEKELAIQKKNKTNSNKNLHTMATTFSETKLKLFKPYSSTINEMQHDQQQQTGKSKSKGNCLVTEFQKMVLNLDGGKGSSGKNRTSSSSIMSEEAPREMFDFTTTNPFEAVKNLNWTTSKQSNGEMGVSVQPPPPRIGSSLNGLHSNDAIPVQKKKTRVKPVLDTGLKKVKRECRITEGMVCSIGNFSLQ